MSDLVRVNMLGEFSLTCGDRSVSDRENRMKKVWLLLAYLIRCRSRVTPQEEFFSLLQSSAGDDAADPNGRMKAMFYRARTMLDRVHEGAGHDWIVRNNGTYRWNPEVPMTVDVDEFEALCRAAAEADGDARLDLYRQALGLYRGDFLPKLSMETWVMPISAYYHQMYLDAAAAALSLLEERQAWQEAAALSETALKIEPYSEELYQSLIRCRIALGDRAGARTAYEEMSELLFSTFGVMPSDESRALYREAVRDADVPTLSADSMRESLREPFGARGAMLCEYDFFRTLYQLQARAIVRSGDVIHIALFSLHGRMGKDLPRRSLGVAMDNLQAILVDNLRQGDVVTRCSISQLIVMLPQANYEDSCMVCRRLLKAFQRQYPHSPAEIRFTVQPLEPKLPEGHALTH